MPFEEHSSKRTALSFLSSPVGCMTIGNWETPSFLHIRLVPFKSLDLELAAAAAEEGFSYGLPLISNEHKGQDLPRKFHSSKGFGEKSLFWVTALGAADSRAKLNTAQKDSAFNPCIFTLTQKNCFHWLSKGNYFFFYFPEVGLVGFSSVTKFIASCSHYLTRKENIRVRAEVGSS